MPTIPTYDRTFPEGGRLSPAPVKIPAPPPMLQVSSESFGSGGKEAGLVAGAMQAIGEAGEAFHRAEQSTTLNNTKLEGLKTISDFKTAAQERNDWQNIVSDFDSLKEQTLKGYQDKIKDPVVLELATNDFIGKSIPAKAELSHLAKQKQIDWGKGNFQGRQAQRLRQFETANPDTRATIISDMTTDIAETTQVGYYKPVEAHKELESFLKGANKISAIQDLNADPENFDPEKYRYLGIEEKDTLTRRAESILNKRRMEEERGKSVERKKMRMTMEDNLASIMNIGQEAPIDKEAMANLFDEADIQAYSQRRNQAWQFNGAWQRLQHAPPEQAQTILDAVKPKTAGPGFEGQQKLHDMLAGAYASERAAFNKDPAGYVATMPGVKDTGDRIAAQEYLGIVRPKVLAKSEVDGLKAQYEGAKPKDKVQLVQGLKEKFGGYTPQALRELELSYDHVFAATQPPRQAEKLIQVLDMKDQDFGLQPETKNDLSKKAKTAFYADDAMGGVLRKIAETTGNAEYMAMARGLENLTTRMTWLQGDQEKGAKETWGDYSFIADKDLAYGWFPKEWDAGAMKRNLREMRDKIEPFISYKKSFFKKPGSRPEVKIDPFTGAEIVEGAEPGTYQEYVHDLKTNGLWVPSPQNDGFILVDPVDGKDVTRKDGRKIKMHWNGYITQ